MRHEPKVETLDFAERWITVGLEVNQPPAFFQVIDVDMSRCKQLIETFKESDTKISYTHMLVHAVSNSLTELPKVHHLVYGDWRYFPSHINIGLMISGDEKSFGAPMMTIAKSEIKNLVEIAQEVIDRAPKVREEGRQQLRFLRRWGWIIPFTFLRRSFYLWMQRSFQKKHPDDLLCFVISTSPGVDQFGGFIFGSAAEIMCGAVRDKVIVVDGQPVVRPIWTLTCIVDHRVWDGKMGGQFLLKLKKVLENAEFKLPQSVSLHLQ